MVIILVKQVNMTREYLAYPGHQENEPRAQMFAIKSIIHVNEKIFTANRKSKAFFLVSIV